jgi:hypothetical protein
VRREAYEAAVARLSTVGTVKETDHDGKGAGGKPFRHAAVDTSVPLETVATRGAELLALAAETEAWMGINFHGARGWFRIAITRDLEAGEC